jgi:hypothetical protein
MSKPEFVAALVAVGFLLSGVIADAADKTVTGCKVSDRHCEMRCKQRPRPVPSKRCAETCRTTQAKCIQQAQKDIELGKVPLPGGGGTTLPQPRQSEEDKKNHELGKTVPPGGGGAAQPGSRLSEEDKKNLEMGKSTPPAGHPTSSPPLQPCASWQIRYSNGTCGCPSGMRGAKCDEIIVH